MWELGQASFLFAKPAEVTCPLSSYDAQVAALDALEPSVEKFGDFGPLVIGNLIHAGEQSVVWEATKEEGEKLIVKRMIDCDSKLEPAVQKEPASGMFSKMKKMLTLARDEKIIDLPRYVPLVREVALSNLLDGKGLVPKVRWVSAAVSFKEPGNLQLPLQAVSACILAGTSERTIVEDRTGPTVGTYLQSRMGMIASDPGSKEQQISFLREVVAVGKESLRLLRLLHNEGVIHGDFHEGNIALQNPDVALHAIFPLGAQKLILIDLGLGALVCSPERDLRTSAFVSEELATPWQLVGSGAKGFRDDIFRMVEMLANSISFRKLQALEVFMQETLTDSLMANGRTKQGAARDIRPMFLKMKTEFDFFTNKRLLYGRFAGYGTNGAYNCFTDYPNLSSKVKNHLAAELGCLLNYARSIPERLSGIHYDFISRKLEKIDQFLTAIGDEAAAAKFYRYFPAKCKWSSGKQVGWF